jgi:CheY-like chemotaxis protein
VATILIVEDDEPLLRELERMLTREGHKCVCLASGKDALLATRQHTPDLLVLDVMLPGASGFEVCRQIRRDPDHYTLPILIVSSMSAEEEISHGLAQGADDYLTKPFDERSFLHHAEALLQLHATAHGTDSLTRLPGPDASKRELQRRLSCKEKFALLCVELYGLRELGRKLGPDSRNRFVEHLGQTLTDNGKKHDTDHFYLGHMGGGYFICAVSPKHYEAFARGIQQSWQQQAKELVDLAARECGLLPESVGEMPLLVCVTVSDTRAFSTVQQMFDTLAQLRHKAQDRKRPGFHVDRRGITG